MIQMYDFMVLNDNEKANQLWDFGIYLTVREIEDFRVNLYRLNNFYVEVFYSVRSNNIDLIKCFKSIEPLNPYLENINIDEL